MITKAKQRIIAAILVIVLAASVLITVNVTSISAMASNEYVETPQITVLTHGLANFNGASHWSNTYNPRLDTKGAFPEFVTQKEIESGVPGQYFHFKYDTDSLIYNLNVKAGGADIYWARSLNSSSYDLYNIGGTNISLHGSDYLAAVREGRLTTTTINDVSKHIIIVFEASDGEASNDTVYNEFEYMLNNVIARVKSLNSGQKNPKVNLIGHSRGGLTNLQYALDHPENVHSMVSVGTPFFGSAAAVALGEIMLGPSAGLNDINNPAIYNSYYTRWKNGYESKYKHINSIAIGGIATIDYLQAALLSSETVMGTALASILTLYESVAGQIVLLGVQAVATAAYAVAGPFIQDKFSLVQFISLIQVLNDEIRLGTWYSDVLVPLDSQLGVFETKQNIGIPIRVYNNYNFTKFVKKFEGIPSINLKRNVNNIPIIHNLESCDSNTGLIIRQNIVISSGDVPAHYSDEISNNGFINRDRKWVIKVVNKYSTRREFAYNTKMCFKDDAKNWTGLTDISSFWLDPGETRIIEIQENGTATSIAVSSISGSTRYIRYADNLDSNLYNMISYGNTKTYYSYSQHGMKVSIAGKNGNKWLINLTNNTGSGRWFDYNKKMCFEGDARDWNGLSDPGNVYLEDGATTQTPIEIQENAFADFIAISYTSGIPRYIYYAKNLNASGTMTSYGNTKPTFYTQNGMKAGIVGKNGNTWAIQLTNNTGSARTFYYNKKMCFEGDAQNWNGLSDITSVYLSNGATTTTPIYIQENAFADFIAISYMDGIYRKVFYAKDLNASSGTMTAMANTIDTTVPPPASCVAEGTLVTLADGSQKAVEDLTGDEMLLVWNMQTGTFDSAPILFIDSDPEMTHEVISLYFHDGSVVKVISEHGFWDLTLNEYVYLDNNAADYIGHWFSKQDTKNNGKIVDRKTKLIDVVIETEVTTAWSPITYGHLCYYVNGMLSMPGGITGLINILEVDPKTMTIDQGALAADIETYGLFTYEEFAEILPVPEIIFEAFNGQYLKIAIGKGLIDFETLGALVERYAEFF